MLAEVASALEARLLECGVFHRVERAVSNTVLSNPPTAVFRLLADTPDGDRSEQQATARRILTYEILIIGPALAVDQGQAGLDTCLDTVREALHLWQALPVGCLPAVLGRLELVDEIKNSLVYAGELEIVVFPACRMP